MGAVGRIPISPIIRPVLCRVSRKDASAPREEPLGKCCCCMRVGRGQNESESGGIVRIAA
ncbi:hypothetical protein OH76DRAFT_1405084 [Lentinus brumalis]|uniref:Uncharacterized protein n=1 Tax=Lentinus brumalis TaxID=2498619 RepID=A0A371D6K8_9APHY|nr:hypothetical protein OH76DRAFT_1405084 [Polyporus brumalis]